MADNVVTSLELSYHDIFFYILFNFMYFSLFLFLINKFLYNIMNNYYPTCESFFYQNENSNFLYANFQTHAVKIMSKYIIYSCLYKS